MPVAMISATVASSIGCTAAKTSSRVNSDICRFLRPYDATQIQRQLGIFVLHTVRSAGLNIASPNLHGHSLTPIDAMTFRRNLPMNSPKRHVYLDHEVVLGRRP